MGKIIKTLIEFYSIQKYKNESQMELQKVTVEEVLKIYDALTEKFKANEDPISPAGIKDENLLNSAVHKQSTGMYGVQKYSVPMENAAALLHGLCLNHPFYNGNKRTALVSTLVHMSKNGFQPNCTHDSFYKLVLSIADHKIDTLEELQKHIKRLVKRKPSNTLNPHADDEIILISAWLKDNSRRSDRRDYPISWREMKNILRRLGCIVEPLDKGFVKINGPEKTLPKRILSFEYGAKKTRVTRTYSCPGENTEVSIQTIKKIRKDFEFTPDFGIDSKSFYDFDGVVDSILLEYQGTLKKLAKR